MNDTRRRGSWLKNRLHRLAIAAEWLFDRLRPPRSVRGGVAIEPYLGWNEGELIVLRGRVLKSTRTSRPVAGQTVWTNIRQIATLFFTAELADVPVTSGDASARTDEEGYFALKRRRDGSGHGWISMAVMVADIPASRVMAPAWITPPGARFVVISDVDDTVLQTGAHSLMRNIWTTLTGNALTRRIFSDAVTYLKLLHADGLNPIFYVSSSPWNLHALLVDVFERNGVVRGPLFLRDLGISEDKFIKSSHGSHKGAAIDTILRANPGLPVLLIGDTGQHDADVYAKAAKRWPDRIRAVVLRSAARDSDYARNGLRDLKAAGIPTFVTDDFMRVADAVNVAMDS